jgi:hypothetical protein
LIAVLLSVSATVGLLGLLLAPLTQVWLWAVLQGLAQGGQPNGAVVTHTDLGALGRAFEITRDELKLAHAGGSVQVARAGLVAQGV